MLDIQNIGARIARLRKEKNMTQMELAERLNISFQAVSNWERGMTAPDIAKLSELSQIFEVSIDELLGNERAAKVIEDIKEKKPVDASDKGLEDVAPLLHPKELDEIVAESAKNDMHSVAALYPFLPEETIDRLLEKAFENGAQIGDIVAVAPFASEKALDAAAKKACEKGVGGRELCALAPFLSDSTLDELAKTAMKDGGVDELLPLMPFLSDEAVSSCVERLTDKEGGVARCAKIAPFVKGEALDKFAVRAASEIENPDELAALAPFLSEKALRQVAEELVEEHGIEAIKPLMPFLS